MHQPLNHDRQPNTRPGETIPPRSRIVAMGQIRRFAARRDYFVGRAGFFFRLCGFTFIPGIQALTLYDSRDSVPSHGTPGSRRFYRNRNCFAL
jgi:hypothetical protein